MHTGNFSSSPSFLYSGPRRRWLSMGRVFSVSEPEPGTGTGSPRSPRTCWGWERRSDTSPVLLSSSGKGRGDSCEEQVKEPRITDKKQGGKKSLLSKIQALCPETAVTVCEGAQLDWQRPESLSAKTQPIKKPNRKKSSGRSFDFYADEKASCEWCVSDAWLWKCDFEENWEERRALWRMAEESRDTGGAAWIYVSRRGSDWGKLFGGGDVIRLCSERSCSQQQWKARPARTSVCVCLEKLLLWLNSHI